MARSRGDSTSEAKPAARSDAYTGLLLIALLAQIAGCVFFFMDWNQYPKKKPDLPPKQVSSTAPTPGPGAGMPGDGGKVDDGGKPDMKGDKP